MLKRYAVVALALVLALSVPRASGGETVESAEAKIIALWDKVNSYTAALDIESTVAQGGTQMKMRATGTVECIKRAESLMYRTEVVNKMDMGSRTIEQKMLSVFDGTDLYTEMDMMGKPTVTKMKPDFRSDMMPGSGKRMFKQLHETFEVRLLPEENVDDEPAYVFDLTMKAGASQTLGKSKSYFSKKTGLQLRMIMHDKSGKPIMTMTYKDFKLNPKLSSARFKYTPPQGVEVMEMPDLQNMMQP